MDRALLLARAEEWFARYGLKADGWRLEFRNYAQRLGCCYYRRRVIALNDYYADHNPEAHVLDTLLHEIAHALVGPRHGHGPVWKAMALRLGCTPRACAKETARLRPGNWQAICPTCTTAFHRYRRPGRGRGYYCTRCGKDQGRLTFTQAPPTA